MIETINNIIFYAGYFFLICLFLLGGMIILYGLTRPILEYKQFALRICNKAIVEQLNKLSEEELQDWIKKVRRDKGVNK